MLMRRRSSPFFADTACSGIPRCPPRPRSGPRPRPGTPPRSRPVARGRPRGLRHALERYRAARRSVAPPTAPPGGRPRSRCRRSSTVAGSTCRLRAHHARRCGATRPANDRSCSLRLARVAPGRVGQRSRSTAACCGSPVLALPRAARLGQARVRQMRSRSQPSLALRVARPGVGRLGTRRSCRKWADQSFGTAPEPRLVLKRLLDEVMPEALLLRSPHLQTPSLDHAPSSSLTSSTSHH
jgi:hypothetical protein